MMNNLEEELSHGLKRLVLVFGERGLGVRVASHFGSLPELQSEKVRLKVVQELDFFNRRNGRPFISRVLKPDKSERPNVRFGILPLKWAHKYNEWKPCAIVICFSNRHTNLDNFVNQCEAMLSLNEGYIKRNRIRVLFLMSTKHKMFDEEKNFIKNRLNIAFRNVFVTVDADFADISRDFVSLVRDYSRKFYENKVSKYKNNSNLGHADSPNFISYYTRNSLKTAFFYNLVNASDRALKYFSRAYDQCFKLVSLHSKTARRFLLHTRRAASLSAPPDTLDFLKELQDPRHDPFLSHFYHFQKCDEAIKLSNLIQMHMTFTKLRNHQIQAGEILSESIEHLGRIKNVSVWDSTLLRQLDLKNRLHLFFLIFDAARGQWPRPSTKELLVMFDLFKVLVSLANSFLDFHFQTFNKIAQNLKHSVGWSHFSKLALKCDNLQIALKQLTVGESKEFLSIYDSAQATRQQPPEIRAKGSIQPEPDTKTQLKDLLGESIVSQDPEMPRVNNATSFSAQTPDPISLFGLDPLAPKLTARPAKANLFYYTRPKTQKFYGLDINDEKPLATDAAVLEENRRSAEELIVKEIDLNYFIWLYDALNDFVLSQLSTDPTLENSVQAAKYYLNVMFENMIRNGPTVFQRVFAEPDAMAVLLKLKTVNVENFQTSMLRLAESKRKTVLNKRKEEAEISQFAKSGNGADSGERRKGKMSGHETVGQSLGGEELRRAHSKPETTPPPPVSANASHRQRPPAFWETASADLKRRVPENSLARTLIQNHASSVRKLRVDSSKGFLLIREIIESFRLKYSSKPLRPRLEMLSRFTEYLPDYYYVKKTPSSALSYPQLAMNQEENLISNLGDLRQLKTRGRFREQVMRSVVSTESICDRFAESIRETLGLLGECGDGWVLDHECVFDLELFKALEERELMLETVSLFPDIEIMVFRHALSIQSFFEQRLFGKFDKIGISLEMTCRNYFFYKLFDAVEIMFNDPFYNLMVPKSEMSLTLIENENELPYLSMSIKSNLVPEISLSRDRTISLKKIRFVNLKSKIAFVFPESLFEPKESLLLETKIMYFPLLLGKLHSRSRNMLLDEYYELDLQANSLVFLANSLSDEDNQLQISNLKMKFEIETINDFKKATNHDLEVFELPIENQILRERHEQLIEFFSLFDYFYKLKAQTVCEEFKETNKDFISRHRSRKSFDSQKFGRFLYQRLKAEKRTQLSKMNQKSILNESKKALAKNIILASAKHFIQHLRENSEPSEEEELVRIEDLIELFVEMQDTEQKRPDFSKIQSKLELKKIFCSTTHRNSERQEGTENLRANQPFKVFSDSNAPRDFNYLKFYLQSKIKERKPFKIRCIMIYDVVQGDELNLVFRESSQCSLEISKAGLPININKILQRTNHILINGVEVSNADKKDRIEKNKSYMMYLYVTSILRKESLLVADLKFVAGDLTHVFREIDWNPGETSCMELELDENEDNKIEEITKAELKELKSEEGLDMGFLFRINKEVSNYNIGDLAICFKREKFKFFSDIQIPNSLKINVRKYPFDISVDFPQNAILYRTFKIEIRIKNFLSRKAEYVVQVSEELSYFEIC